jgi:ubiquitin C-terminal hydrolase
MDGLTVPLKGLDNLGNTCFINGSLQALYAIKEFREYIMGSICRKPIHQSMSKLFQSMTSSNDKSIDPIDFINTFAKYKPEFGDRRQHDSQEFIRFLIDGIHEEFEAFK